VWDEWVEAPVGQGEWAIPRHPAHSVHAAVPSLRWASASAARPWSQTTAGRWCPLLSATGRCWRGSFAGSRARSTPSSRHGMLARCTTGSTCQDPCDPRDLTAALLEPVYQHSNNTNTHRHRLTISSRWIWVSRWLPLNFLSPTVPGLCIIQARQKLFHILFLHYSTSFASEVPCLILCAPSLDNVWSNQCHCYILNVQTVPMYPNQSSYGRLQSQIIFWSVHSYSTLSK